MLEVPASFRRHIRYKISNCVLFSGAGLSRAMRLARGQSLPDWRTLTRQMVKELQSRVNDSEKRNLDRSLEQSDFLAVAEKFQKKTRPDAYSDFLRDQLDPPDFSRSAFLDIVFSINWRGILTTNFDRVIEFHTRRYRPLIYPHFLTDPGAFHGQAFLAKVHGCISTPNPKKNLILSSSDYARLRRNRQYQDLMRGLIISNPVLIVGFSLTDPDFLGLVNDMEEIFSGQVPTIYALMRQPSLPDRDHWRARSIELIPYKEHRDLKGFFESLLEMSESETPSGRVKTNPIRFTNVKTVKKDAWNFYCKWKVSGSISPRFGKVEVTVKGWAHVTRASRPQSEVCHKLSLLPCAKEIIEKSRESILVRRFGDTLDIQGRKVTRELHVLKGRSVQRFRSDLWIDVVLELTKLKETGETLSVKFYSVFENRS